MNNCVVALDFLAMADLRDAMHGDAPFRLKMVFRGMRDALNFEAC